MPVFGAVIELQVKSPLRLFGSCFSWQSHDTPLCLSIVSNGVIIHDHR